MGLVSRIIFKPMNIITAPPIKPTQADAEDEVINQPNPSRISRMSRTSPITWPNTNNGPALDPFLKESEIVTVKRGPGAMAPESPIMKEVAVKIRTSSI